MVTLSLLKIYLPESKGMSKEAERKSTTHFWETEKVGDFWKALRGQRGAVQTVCAPLCFNMNTNCSCTCLIIRVENITSWQLYQNKHTV